MQTLLLLDLDGTLIDTPHHEAWCYAARQMGVEDFTYEEYVTCIAGRPRLEGASRLIELKKNGARVDMHHSYSSTLAEIKQLEFLRLSANAKLFDDALRFLERIEASRQRVRIYTASQNAPGLFRAALRTAGKSLSHQPMVRQRHDQTREALFSYLVGEHAIETVTLIDDAPHSVDIASRLGIRAYQIRRIKSQPTATDPSACIVASLDDVTLPDHRLCEGHNK